MALRKILVKICLIWLSIQEEALKTNSITELYTTEGSTMNIIPKMNEIRPYLDKTHTTTDGAIYSFSLPLVTKSKFDIVLRPNVLEFQIKNVTASDKGFYWFYYPHHSPYWTTSFILDLQITNVSCPFFPIRVCAIEGSTLMHTYVVNCPVYHSTIGVHINVRNKSRIVSNIRIHVELLIYNVTREDEGEYVLELVSRVKTTKLQVAKLWFINQTNLNTIVGQEGTPMEIKCYSDTEQCTTALKLEYKDSIKAIGDHQSVSFSFIPDRTDDMTNYKCLDSTHLAMMIEVQLIIMYAPTVTVRYTNETVECVGHGNPEIYNVYRLDKFSMYSELVRSVNLNNETLILNMNQFPYQRNGRYACVVSNGIPDINRTVLQTQSIYVKYEGPPVFSPENTNVKTGEVGKSITLSFQIYSYPVVEHILIKKIGQKQKKYKTDIKYNIQKFLLHYMETGNMVEILGYEILIETKALEVDDFQAYLIIATNRLGESNYHFEIINKENLPLGKSKRIVFVIICCIATILLVYLTITHVCLCVKYVKTRSQRVQNLQEDHIYHTYDEIGTISFRALSSLRSADTIDNLGQNPTEEHTDNVAIDANLQSTTDITEITEEHWQRMSISLLNTNFSNTDISPISSTGISRIKNVANCNQSIKNTERSREQKGKTCNDSRSGSSTNVTICSVRNGYENNYQVQYGHLNHEIRDDRRISISATDSSTKIQQQIQPSDDSESGSSNNVMVDYIGDGYKNPYQMILQDHTESHPYTEIIKNRHSVTSSTESDKTEEQVVQPGRAKE